MSTLSQFLILMRAHFRMLRVRTMLTATTSRIMTAAIVSFLLAYSVTAYFLFLHGLNYVKKLPAAGALLSDRIIYLMFFCFLLMLIFSVAVTAYIALYRNRDTKWLLTLPVSHKAIFLWKAFESSLYSSWGMLVILAPLLLAFANVREVSLLFFLKTLGLLIPFLLVASIVGALVLITAVRWFNRKQIAIGAVLIAIVVISSAVLSGLEGEKIANETMGLSSGLTFQRVLHHTNISVNRALPSTWMATSLIDWSRPYQNFNGLLYPALLISNLLFGLLLLGFAGQKWFYRSWNYSLQQSAQSVFVRNSKSHSDEESLQRNFPKPSFMRHITGRPLAALARKDFLTFFREPAQWVQFAVIFGLLAIYCGGLRQINGEIAQPRDQYLVAFLNLGVCALALSTLTTRFVFPQFSLEGRRLWILAMSPMKLPGIVIQKFLTGSFYSGLLVVMILLLSGYNLRLPWQDTVFFAVAIALLALGLNALAVGYGVMFPNLEESNAAKIVNGSGGTLCLVSSFIFVVTFILILAWSRIDVFRQNEFSSDWIRDPGALAPISMNLAITAMVTTLPLIFSQKRLKRLEIIKNV